MKKSMLLVAMGLTVTTSFAQSRFYLSPNLGAGLGNASQDFYMTQLPGNKIRKVSTLTYNVGLNAGYRFGRWRLETGLQYGISGFKNDDLLFGSTFPDDTKLGSSIIRYKHLSIPLKVGYEVKLSEKLKFVPYIGMMASYNLGASSANTIPGIGNETHKWSREDFDYSNRRISIWGTAAARLEYTVSKRISIFAGPSAQYMLSNLLKPPADLPNPYKASQRNFNLHIDIGVQIKL